MRKLLSLLIAGAAILGMSGTAHAYSNPSNIAGSSEEPGYCLDIPDNKPGTRVVVADCHFESTWTSQKWVRSTQSSAVYGIKNRVPGPNGTEMCLDVAPGSAVVIAQCNFADHFTSQKWYPVNLSNGWRMLRNGAQQNGKWMCIDRSNNLGSGVSVTPCNSNYSSQYFWVGW